MNKKKILIFILFVFFIFISTSCNHITNEDNSLLYNIDEIKPYLSYERFVIEDYEEIESLRKENSYTYQEAINYYYCTDQKEAIFLNTTLVLINKQFFVQSSYVPPLFPTSLYNIKTTKDNIFVQKIVLDNYYQMISDLNLKQLFLFSGYRSFERQKEIFSNSLDERYCAKPGFSEHQSGLCIDVSTLYYGLSSSFQYSEEAKIIADNCHKYGFIIRYPLNKEHITLYNYEPWHLRYVGKIHATFIYENNLCLEEYIFKYFSI